MITKPAMITGIRVTDADREQARAYTAGMPAGVYVVVLAEQTECYPVSGLNDASRRARHFRATQGAPVLTVAL